MSSLQEIVPDQIWCSERQVWFSGVKLRARSTVVRLSNGALLLHSPPVPTEELLAQWKTLGEVRYIAVPNCFHHLGVPAAAALFPNAKVIGPASAIAHNNKLSLHFSWRDPWFAQQVAELEVHPLEGFSFLDETLLFHRKSGSLIGADIVMSATEQDHFSWRWVARITGGYKTVRVPPDVRLKAKANPALASSIRRLAALPSKRLMVAHTDPIEHEPGKQLLAAWRFAVKGEG